VLQRRDSRTGPRRLGAMRRPTSQGSNRAVECRRFALMTESIRLADRISECHLSSLSDHIAACDINPGKTHCAEECQHDRQQAAVGEANGQKGCD